jgi:hypothetical protein
MATQVKSKRVFSDYDGVWSDLCVNRIMDQLPNNQWFHSAHSKDAGYGDRLFSRTIEW